MKKTLRFIPVLIMVLFISHLAMAADEFFIPLGTTGKPAKIITVSHRGGDFTDPVAAVASITDASADNPYLVLIGPGVYRVTKTLAMQPFVSIAGAGQETTVLTGAIGSEVFGATSALVSGADNATLSDLTIENTGGGLHYSIALYNENSSPVIHDVTANASGRYDNRGVSNYKNSSPIMTNVTATASGGFYNCGVTNSSSFPTMTSVTATASEGVSMTYSTNYGVSNFFYSSPTMINVTATASGGTYNYGVGNTNTSPTMTMNMTNVTATAIGGERNYGIYNDHSSSTMINVTATGSGGISSWGMHNHNSSLIIRQCIVSGENVGIQNSFGTIMVMQSSISGGVGVTEGDTLTCVHSDDGEAAELDLNCQPLP